nr:protein Daple-like [Ipomoea batatas]
MPTLLRSWLATPYMSGEPIVDTMGQWQDKQDYRDFTSPPSVQVLQDWVKTLGGRAAMAPIAEVWLRNTNEDRGPYSTRGEGSLLHGQEGYAGALPYGSLGFHGVPGEPREQSLDRAELILGESQHCEYVEAVPLVGRFPCGFVPGLSGVGGTLDRFPPPNFSLVYHVPIDVVPQAVRLDECLYFIPPGLAFNRAMPMFAAEDPIRGKVLTYRWLPRIMEKPYPTVTPRSLEEPRRTHPRGPAPQLKPRSGLL